MNLMDQAQILQLSNLNMWHGFITANVPRTQLRDSYEIDFGSIKVCLSFY